MYILRNTMLLALYAHIKITIKAIMFHVLRNLTQTILFIMTLTLKSLLQLVVIRLSNIDLSR